MRFGDYYIKLGLDANDLLSMILLTILWFLGIFAFRMGLAFLELMPQLGTLPEDFIPSPGVELLTWRPLLTSTVPALLLGPITHFAITGAAAFKVYRGLAESAVLEEPLELDEGDYPDEREDGERGGRGRYS
jgi:hypothetical protein